MKRPKQHEIDTKAQRIFISSLPSSWVVREQHPDYGIDYDIEIFDNSKPTGISFYAQLKGTSSPNYSEQSLRFLFEVDKLTYYLDKVKKPTFLIVVDVNTRKSFWLSVQMYIQSVLYKTKPDWYKQKMVTLDIPLINALPDSIDKLQTTAEEGFKYVYLLQIGRPNLKLTLEIQNKLDDDESVKTAITQAEIEAGELKIYLAERHLQEDKREEALAEFVKIFNETKEQASAEIHIASATKLVYAGDFLDHAENRKLVKFIEIALQREAESKYKSVIFLAKATKYFLDVIFHFQEIRNLDIFSQIAELQKRGTDQLIRIFQSEAFKEYDIAFEGMYSTISEALKENELHAATEIMVKLSELYLFMTPFLIIKEEQDANAMLEYTDKIIEIAFYSANTLNNPDLICYALQSKSNLYFQQNKDYEQVLDEMLNIATANKLVHFQQAAIRLKKSYQNTGSLKNVSKPIPKEITIEQEIEYFKSLAKIGGIDLEDKNDPVAQVIALGIRDLNPERVLKNCQNLYIAVVSYGLPGEIFGLPTAGSKIIYCDQKKTNLSGMELDNIFSVFQGKNCKDCPNKKSYPQYWKWTRLWQRERDKNLPTGLTNILNAMRNPKPYERRKTT